MKIICQYIRWGYLAESEDRQHRSGPCRTHRPQEAATIVADKAFGPGNYTLRKITRNQFEASPNPVAANVSSR